MKILLIILFIVWGISIATIGFYVLWMSLTGRL